MGGTPRFSSHGSFRGRLKWCVSSGKLAGGFLQELPRFNKDFWAGRKSNHSISFNAMKIHSKFHRTAVTLLAAAMFFTQPAPSLKAQSQSYEDPIEEQRKVEAGLAIAGVLVFEIGRRNSESAFERAIAKTLRDKCTAAAIKRVVPGTNDVQANAGAMVFGLAIEGRLDGANLTAEGIKALIDSQMGAQSFETQAVWNIGLFLEEMFSQWQRMP